MNANNPHGRHSVGVQFSGKPTIYNYSIHPEVQVQPGNRVVVAQGIKDDNTLSMSIATVIGVNREPYSAMPLLPVVMVIDPAHVSWCIEDVKRSQGVVESKVA